MKIGELTAIAEKKKDEVVPMQSFSKQWKNEKQWRIFLESIKWAKSSQITHGRQH